MATLGLSSQTESELSEQLSSEGYRQKVDLRYYPDTDSFSLYLSQAFPGCEGNVDFVPLPTGPEPRRELEISRDASNKVMVLSISPSTPVVAPHFWCEYAYVEHKPPVVISESYDLSADVLDVDCRRSIHARSDGVLRCAGWMHQGRKGRGVPDSFPRATIGGRLQRLIELVLLASRLKKLVQSSTNGTVRIDGR